MSDKKNKKKVKGRRERERCKQCGRFTLRVERGLCRECRGWVRDNKPVVRCACQDHNL